MFSIKENINKEIIINKSRFITELIKVNNDDAINEILSEIKKEYVGATHYCYAYICGNKKKCSDDGEPSGTAGVPILNVLEKNNLNNILCVVIRYFGGIKLGAGGLVRAYSKAVTECLNDTEIINLIDGKKIKIVFSYDNIKQIDYILTDIKIVDKIFSDKISYTFLISDMKYQKIYNELTLYTSETYILDKVMIEEEKN